LKRVCDEILSLLEVWDAFCYHTDKTCLHRRSFPEQSIKGIHRLQACLRNKVKLAFRVENTTTVFAQWLKLLVAATIAMQLHMTDMPFEAPLVLPNT
jgi:hypothetical protein